MSIVEVCLKSGQCLAGNVLFACLTCIINNLPLANLALFVVCHFGEYGGVDPGCVVDKRIHPNTSNVACVLDVSFHLDDYSSEGVSDPQVHLAGTSNYTCYSSIHQERDGVASCRTEHAIT